MFFRERLKIIEEKIAAIEQKEKCRIGQHKWITVQDNSYRPPYIRCSQCYTKPEPEKTP